MAKDFSGDAQLVNSVYFDNQQMELYHGRIEKSPGAIAIRVRWYGGWDPTEWVFFERKTHQVRNCSTAWPQQVLWNSRIVLFCFLQPYASC